MALHLSSAHPLAGIAASHCVAHAAPLVGGISCGVCWERAIRDDERFAVEFDLPRDAPVDPNLVDQVAVDRVLRGEAIRLTSAERLAAVAQLHYRSATPGEIARVLGISHATVLRELNRAALAVSA